MATRRRKCHEPIVETELTQPIKDAMILLLKAGMCVSVNDDIGGQLEPPELVHGLPAPFIYGEPDTLFRSFDSIENYNSSVDDSESRCWLYATTAEEIIEVLCRQREAWREELVRDREEYVQEEAQRKAELAAQIEKRRIEEAERGSQEVGGWS